MFIFERLLNILAHLSRRLAAFFLYTMFDTFGDNAPLFRNSHMDKCVTFRWAQKEEEEQKKTETNLFNERLSQCDSVR